MQTFNVSDLNRQAHEMEVQSLQFIITTNKSNILKRIFHETKKKQTKEFSILLKYKKILTRYTAISIFL